MSNLATDHRNDTNLLEVMSAAVGIISGTVATTLYLTYAPTTNNILFLLGLVVVFNISAAVGYLSTRTIAKHRNKN